ncbi:MAG: hypothetical protein J6W80_00880 [Kiritimatiellae bacterium]|nr:hypothetical protein [Kiritimatiellia bacterium]
MRKAFPIFPFLCFVLLAGCVSTDPDAENAIMALRTGNGAEALEWSGDYATNSHYSTNLGLVEHGRVNMLLNRHAEARDSFRLAIDSAIDRKERSPKVKFGDVGNTLLASTITDDRTRQYYLAPYEINLAIEYAIINQEILGEREDALVDARLAEYVMENLAETYGNDVAADTSMTNSGVSGVCDSQTAQMYEVLAQSRNSWENPLLWWLTGVLHEADGDRESALASYRRAALLRSDNPVFVEDASRVPTRLSPAKDKAKLVIVCGEGFISRRQSLKVPVPIYTGMAIDIPMYKDSAYSPKGVTVSVDGAVPSGAFPAVNIQSLAYRDLKEHLPGIIARNISRAAVQAGAQAAVNAAGNDYAKIAVFVGNAVVSALRSADIRSWRTLPMSEQVWRSDTLEPGERRVDVKIGTRLVSTTVKLKPGETKIIYVNSMEE